MADIRLLGKYFLGRLRRIYFMALPESKADLKKSRVCYTIGDSAVQTIGNLTAGTIFASLMTNIGVSDANIGVIISLASLAAVSQLLTMGLTNRLKKYKLLVCFTASARILLSFIFFIPLLPITDAQKMWLLIGCFLTAQVCAQIGGPAASDWIASLVPAKLRGRYLSIKDSSVVLSVSVALLIAGGILDFFKSRNIIIAFIIIGIIIFLLVVISTTAFSCMKEPRLADTDALGREMHGHLAKKNNAEQNSGRHISLPAELKAALLSPKFRAVFFLNIMWMNCAYISAQFNASYQIKELNLSYTFLMVIGFISNLLRIYITPKIGRYGDYYGMARVLKYFILTLGIQYLLLAFTVPGNAYIMTVILSPVGAVAYSFIGIGLFGIQLDLINRERRMIQLTLVSSLGGLYGFAVCALGGRLLDYFQNNPLVLFGHSLYAQQVLNVLGFTMTVLTFLYIKLVVQKIDAEDNTADGEL